MSFTEMHLAKAGLYNLDVEEAMCRAEPEDLLYQQKSLDDLLSLLFPFLNYYEIQIPGKCATLALKQLHLKDPTYLSELTKNAIANLRTPCVEEIRLFTSMHEYGSVRITQLSQPQDGMAHLIVYPSLLAKEKML